MCGYVSYESKPWNGLSGQLESIVSLVEAYRAYPAFGGDTHKRIPIVVIDDGQLVVKKAIWWFDAFADQQGQSVLGRRTTFNARNLDSPFWKTALNHNRAVVLASELGESKKVGKSTHRFLMQSHSPFFLGALYRKLANGDYCAAVITRDAHPKFTPYHEKAFPFFLPPDDEFLTKWLWAAGAISPEVECILQAPILVPTLNVTRVKTYKNKEPIGQIRDTLVSDLKE